MAAMASQMKTDWNLRAAKNAEYYIASTNFASAEQFRQSGSRDVKIFFRGLEHLIHCEQDILDLGCGIGRMDETLSPRVRSLVGVDVSSGMINRAKTRLAHLSNTRFVEVSGCDLSPIPDNSVTLIFSHIVFQHMPKSVVRAYVSDAYRVLVPGGHIVFQVPERLPSSPPDPVNEDTFGMRYHLENEIRCLFDHLRYRDIRFDRPPKATEDSVDHLRVCARTETTIEKMAVSTNPSRGELEQWAYSWGSTAPTGWIDEIATTTRMEEFLSYAADPACPQRDWFLRGLYLLASRALASDCDSQTQTTLRQLSRKAVQFHGHPWVARWSKSVTRHLEKGTKPDSSWVDGRHASMEVSQFIESSDQPMTKRIHHVLDRMALKSNCEVPSNAQQLASLFVDVASPLCLSQRLEELGLNAKAPLLAEPLWLAWRRSIRESP